jgi:hypothetical protein
MSGYGDLISSRLRIGREHSDFMFRLPRTMPDRGPTSVVLVLHGDQPDVTGQIHA